MPSSALIPSRSGHGRPGWCYAQPGTKQQPRTSTGEEYPVQVTAVSITPCRLCREPVSYRRVPGAAEAALTDHYNREHAAALAVIALPA